MKILYHSEDGEYEKLCVNVVRKVCSNAKIYICHDLATAGKTLMLDRMDIVIFNLNLRRNRSLDQDGMRFLEYLRRMPGYALTPMLVLLDMEDARFYTYNRLHAYACYQKPLNEKLFHLDVKKLVREKDRQSGYPDEDSVVHCFRKRDELYVVREEELVRVEKTRDSGLVVTTEREYDVDVRSLRRDTQLFYSGRFIRCSRTNYVNPRYIRKVDRNCIRLRDEYGDIKPSKRGYREAIRRMTELQEELNQALGDIRDREENRKRDDDR